MIQDDKKTDNEIFNLTYNDKTGNMSAKISDQYTEPVSLYLGRQLALATLVNNIPVGTYQFQITSSVAPVVGNRICLKNGTYFAQPRITAVSGTNPYAITIGTPVDGEFVISSPCYLLNTNLASVAGTQASPQIYQVSPKGLTAGTRFDIIGMTIHMLSGSPMDDATFGGGTALVNGMIFRSANSHIKNFANIRNNGDFGDYGFAVEYVEKAPASQYALRAYLDIRKTFGVAIRLSADNEDSAQILIQDTISATNATDIHVVAHGHVVD